jgi:hypothetical protein
LATIEDPDLAAAQRASFFHSQAVAWTGVLFCGVASLTPEMEKAGNDDERKGHAAELTNC